jgi:hypothetical protein
LKAGEISKLELRTEHLKRFIVGLQVLKDAAAEKGIEFGDIDLVVGKREEMVRVDVDQKAAIEQLIDNDYSAEFLVHTLIAATGLDCAARGCGTTPAATTGRSEV